MIHEIPEYPGSTLSDAELDRYLKALVSAADVEEFNKLAPGKWWAYRHLHPMRAILIIEQERNNLMREYAKYYPGSKFDRHEEPGSLIDIDPERYGRSRKGSAYDPVRKDKALGVNKQTATCFLRTAIAADRHGIIYSYWVRSVFEFTVKKIWTGPPLPNQGYSEPVCKFAVERWNTGLQKGGDSPRSTKDPYYGGEEYADLPYQREYHQRQLDVIAGSSVPEFVFGRSDFLRFPNLLPLAVDRFGREWVEKVKGKIAGDNAQTEGFLKQRALRELRMSVATPIAAESPSNLGPFTVENILAGILMDDDDADPNESGAASDQPDQTDARPPPAYPSNERRRSCEQVDEAPPEAVFLDPETEALIDGIGAFLDKEVPATVGGTESASSGNTRPASSDQQVSTACGALTSPRVGNLDLTSRPRQTLNEDSRDRMLKALTNGILPPQTDDLLSGRHSSQRGSQARHIEMEEILAEIDTDDADEES